MAYEKIIYKGRSPETMKRDLIFLKPTHFKQQEAYRLLNDSSGECSLLNETAVYSNIRQQSRDKQIGIKEFPGDSIESIMNMMDKMSHIREFSTVSFYLLLD